MILESTGECGVIVCMWASDELGGMEDCYVAFFGDKFPPQDGPPPRLPYILRYATSSLKAAVAG